MTITSDLIASTRRWMLASGREQLNRLTTGIDETDDTVTVDFDLGQIATGAIIALDLELMYVWSIAGSDVTVQRGVQGSTPAAHAAGALITVNPLVPDFTVFVELNNELRALSSPANGLFRVETKVITATVASSYDLADDVRRVLGVWWNDYGPTNDWPRVQSWDLLADQDLSVFPSGTAIRLYDVPDPGRTIRVAYAAPLDTLSELDDDVEATTGLADSAVDIPPMGAAARLLSAREARRSSIDAKPESRQAADVPAGAARSASAQLFALRDRRIREESARFAAAWPNYTRRAV